MKLTERFKRWADRRAAMAELTVYCHARVYAREAQDWHLVDACNAAADRKAREIAKMDASKP